MKKIVIAALAATALVSTPALASHDAFPGMVVSKGDVQTAFGWNNAAFQADVADVKFTYSRTSTYSGTCTATVTTTSTEQFQDNGKGKTHTRTVTKTVQIPGSFSSVVPLSSSISTEMVLNGKKTVAHIIGINIPAASASDANAPTDGGACTVQDEDGTDLQGVLSDLQVSSSDAKVVGRVGSAGAEATFWQHQY